MKGQFNTNRGFGVEIEYSRPATISNEQIARKIEESSLGQMTCRVENYNHETRSHWKIVSDSSVGATNRTQRGRNELVSPILYGNIGLRQIVTVCDVLGLLGCTVNITCGLHVHHDVREQIRDAQAKNAQAYIEKMVKFVAKFEHCIYKLVSPSRIGGHFSTPVRKFFYVDDAPITDLIASDKDVNKEIKKEVKKAVKDLSIQNRMQRMRACGLNLNHVFTRGSVEFRYHQGTINADKITNWIVVTQMILNAVESKRSVSLKYVVGGRAGMGKFRQALGVNKTMDTRGKRANTWMKTTFTKFNRRESEYTRHRNYELVMEGV